MDHTQSRSVMEARCKQVPHRKTASLEFLGQRELFHKGFEPGEMGRLEDPQGRKKCLE